MIHDLKPYPTYKDSCVHWLGEVPEHWELQRLKYSARLIMGQSPSSADCSPERIGLPFLQGCAEFGPDHPRPKQFCQAPAKTSPPAAILMSVRAPVGRLNVADQEYGIGRGLCALVPNARLLNTAFAYYALSSYAVGLTIVSTGSTYDAVSVGDVGGLSWLLPPLPEQAAIVRFLDYADRRIRKYISAKQKLIKLLEEQKQAIIHRAVTRGLDPDVRLKPSGVEWLGDVPEHWEVSQLRRIVESGRRITYGIVQPGELDPSGRFMVRGQDYSSGWVQPERIFRVSELIEVPYKRSRLSQGDIVLTIVGAGVGNVAITPAWLDGANITQTTARVAIDRSKADGEFIAAVLQGPVGRRNVKLYVKGAAQPGLNLEHVRIFLVPVPPLEEQKQIVTVLSRATMPLQTSVDYAQGEISLLREYRTRLVADVVTGKLDAREAAAKLPEEVDEPELLDDGDAPSDADEDGADDLDIDQEVDVSTEVES